MNHSPSKHLIVVPTAKINGAERVMFNLAYYLLEKGDYVTLVTMSRGKSSDSWNELQKHPNFKWLVGIYNSEKSSLIPITIKLFKLNIENKFDYIFSTHIHINSYLNTLKRMGLFKKAELISRDSFAVFEANKSYRKRIAFKLIYKFFYGQQDLLICQTELMKNSLINNLGFNPVKTTEVIPNPVNLSYIKSNTGDLSTQKIVIACGRLVEVKQFNLLIEAFSIFSKDNPEYRLIILGDGPLKTKLETQARQLGIYNKTTFLGKVDNPFEWFAKSEIGVIPSKTEGFPNVLLEMMASGTSKIIITPCTGGLHKIPNLMITNDFTAKSILNELNKAVSINNSFSTTYQKYIADNHSVSSFWNKIVKLLSE